jgi:hypothetical protein|tara:strand:- start:3 stop:194 length:192 start_codon:yes stop_codon:yes gene_type:complete
MDIPDSPMEMQREWIRSQLDELPEGSSVTISVELYRDMITKQLLLGELVARQQKLLEIYVPDY